MASFYGTTAIPQVQTKTPATAKPTGVMRLALMWVRTACKVIISQK